MVSESARMTTAHEARFRIGSPNSRPRSMAIIAIDAESGPWLSALGRAGLQHARLYHGYELIADRTRLAEAIGGADAVVMIGVAGAAHSGIDVIGEECSRRRVSTTGLLHCPTETADDRLMGTLRIVRPWLMMLVILRSTDYVEDVLRSMGA